MEKFEQLKVSVLADGKIDEQEVRQIRKVIYADGVIDKEEAEFLFELNDAVSGKENHPTWEVLFVEAITDFLLADPNSPNEIDAEKEEWLLGKIQCDGQVDKIEASLLMYLKAKAKEMPQSLINLLNNNGA